MPSTPLSLRTRAGPAQPPDNDCSYLQDSVEVLVSQDVGRRSCVFALPHIRGKELFRADAAGSGVDEDGAQLPANA